MGKIYMKDNMENPLLFICFRQFISIVFVDIFCLLQCLVFVSLFLKSLLYGLKVRHNLFINNFTI